MEISKAFGVWCLTFLEAVNLIASRVATRSSQRAAGTPPSRDPGFLSLSDCRH